MSQRQFNVRVLGLEQVLRDLNRMVDAQAQADIDGIAETYARKMAEESAAMAPVDLGGLRGSIASSPQESDDNIHIWEWGSNLPYATRMEYTHPTNKGFVRKAIWNNRQKYRDAVIKRIKRS